jgi:hypothetical protein
MEKLLKLAEKYSNQLEKQADLFDKLDVSKISKDLYLQAGMIRAYANAKVNNIKSYEKLMRAAELLEVANRLVKEAT